MIFHDLCDFCNVCFRESEGLLQEDHNTLSNNSSNTNKDANKKEEPHVHPPKRTIDEERWLLTQIKTTNHNNSNHNNLTCPSPTSFLEAIGEKPLSSNHKNNKNSTDEANKNTSPNPLHVISSSRTQLWKPNRSWWEAKSGKNPWIEPRHHAKRWRYLWPLIHYHKMLCKCIKKLKRFGVEVVSDPKPLCVFLRSDVVAISHHLAHVSSFTSEDWTAGLTQGNPFHSWSYHHNLSENHENDKEDCDDGQCEHDMSVFVHALYTSILSKGDSNASKSSELDSAILLQQLGDADTVLQRLADMQQQKKQKKKQHPKHTPQNNPAIYHHPQEMYMYSGYVSAAAMNVPPHYHGMMSMSPSHHHHHHYYDYGYHHPSHPAAAAANPALSNYDPRHHGHHTHPSHHHHIYGGVDAGDMHPNMSGLEESFDTQNWGHLNPIGSLMSPPRPPHQQHGSAESFPLNHPDRNQLMFPSSNAPHPSSSLNNSNISLHSIGSGNAAFINGDEYDTPHRNVPTPQKKQQHQGVEQGTLCCWSLFEVSVI